MFILLKASLNISQILPVTISGPVFFVINTIDFMSRLTMDLYMIIHFFLFKQFHLSRMTTQKPSYQFLIFCCFFLLMLEKKQNFVFYTCNSMHTRILPYWIILNQFVMHLITYYPMVTYVQTYNQYILISITVDIFIFNSLLYQCYSHLVNRVLCEPPLLHPILHKSTVYYNLV